MFRGDAIRGMLVAWQTPWLAARLGMPADQPLFFSVGQLGSVLIGVLLITLALRRTRAMRTPAP